ncbi:MAG: hypothetical protein HUU02_07240 [Bacteroidetes bacterium]|nr:hypothetical protein [Bacteroidota bacterium]
MKRILWLLLLLSASLPAQRTERIVSYDLRAALNGRTGTIAGVLTVALDRTTARREPLAFAVPRQWEIAAVRDHENETVDLERSSAEQTGLPVVRIDEPEDADTVRLTIEFTARFDSSRFAGAFITSNELFLPCTDSLGWLPLFGAVDAGRVSFELTSDGEMSFFAAVPLDSQATERGVRCSFSAAAPVQFSEVFTLAGIVRPVRVSNAGSDSLSPVTFIIPPTGFDRQYAEAVCRQLSDAASFFSARTGKHPGPGVTYVIAGNASGAPEAVEFNGTIFHRGSPAYSRFDSASLHRFGYNHWLLETARRFVPVTADSTSFFDDGFASYLVHRFLSERFPAQVQQERINAIANTLTFFPQPPVNAGHRTPLNTDAIVAYRGRYILLMLEYLLGTPAFDSVIVRMSQRFSAEPASFEVFRQLCEEEYGTPLGWFFDQWFRRSDAPEYVMQWSHARTPRGMSVVTVTVEQRGVQFRMPLPVHFTFGRRTIVKRILAEQHRQEFTFVFPTPPSTVELDPQYTVLRWLLELRISAHARTALQYLTIARDIENAEREAQYTLQLDPNNSTGSAPLVYFVLGNCAAAKGEPVKAKEYFQKTLTFGAAAEMEQYKLLSLLRTANLLQAEGKQEESAALYRRVIADGMADPLLYEHAIIKAERRLQTPAGNSEDQWFALP